MKKFVLLVCLFLIPLTLVSETQHRFRVVINVFEGKQGDVNDAFVKEFLEVRLKKEFYLLEDVDIVELNDEWHFEFWICYMQNIFTDGRKSGDISIAYGFSERVPLSYFKEDHYLHFGLPPVYLRRLGVGSFPMDKLDEYCVDAVSYIDKVILRPRRELIRELLQ